MHAQGGYMLHLDGTCEGGGPMLMSSLDSLSEIVLGNVKVPSERAEQLVPFLQEIRRRYGVPVAIVHDMGLGILAAVQEVFPAVPDFICHFHFLRDIGNDLLEADYDAIRQRLRHHGLSQRLLQHARRLKAAIDAEPGLVESFCQNVQGRCLPSPQLLTWHLRFLAVSWHFSRSEAGEGEDPNLSAFLGAKHSHRAWGLSRHLMSAFEMVELRGAPSSLIGGPACSRKPPESTTPAMVSAVFRDV
jgi:GNAT superfamily N-acetyltransferase